MNFENDETEVLVGIRRYLDTPLIHNIELTDKLPKTFKDYMDNVRSLSGIRYDDSLDWYVFDSKHDDGDYPTTNILSDYMSWMMNHNEFFQKVKFNKYASVYLEYKPHTIAYSVYGNPHMFYILMVFNDIYHPSDFTRDRLENQGIMVLNSNGIEALRKILELKRIKETNEINPFVNNEF